MEPAYRGEGNARAPYGVRVTAVSPASPANRAGIRAGDVITSVNSAPVTSLQELQAALAHSGGQATISVRDGRAGTTRRIPSLSLAAPVPGPSLATSIRPAPALSVPGYARPPGPYGYAPSYGGPRNAPSPGAFVPRPFYYGNYGDAPSPNPFSFPPSYRAGGR